MTVKQWSNVDDRVKTLKTRYYMVKGAAKAWCLANGVDVRTGFRQTVDEGKWRFDCLVIKCINFDANFYRELMKE
jgi:hypothetical protein